MKYAATLRQTLRRNAQSANLQPFILPHQARMIDLLACDLLKSCGVAFGMVYPQHPTYF